ncbi:unnamed protein product [Darwinula stevensoni]|uniref:Dystroglycan 1 n=1 Tax=Darwinula stevensoni TaxID=69355 RepID=A0A7R8X1C1_9CRUS|nr:unnamed protein product [Darwinula stevensoni]CAG0882637.1 unnamed protein product [Darwinula stevensoni]
MAVVNRKGLVIAMVVLWNVVTGIHLENDIEKYMGDLELEEGDLSHFQGVDSVERRRKARAIDEDRPENTWLNHGEGGLRRMWGIPDASVGLGQFFSYPIPQDAFAGDVSRFSVEGHHGLPMPSWLYFDPEHKRFEGVPTERDLGHHYISVTAHGVSVSGESSVKAKDVFAVNVVRRRGQAGSCPVSEDDLTMFSLVVDADLNSLAPSERVKVLTNIAQYLGIQQNEVWLISEPEDPLEENSALSAGPGNALRKRYEHPTWIQWKVGCKGMVSPEAKSVVQRLEEEAADGTMAEVTGYPIVGWHVTEVSPKSMRIRRQAFGSGEFLSSGHIDDEDYYLREDHEEGSGVEPSGRVVPTMASPIFPEATVYHSAPNLSPSLESSKITASIEEDEDDFFLTPLETTSPVYPRVPFTTPIPPTSTKVIPEVTASSASTPGSGSILPTDETEVEYGTKNWAPSVSERMGKQALFAGKLYRKKIPESLFVDFEDGNTRDLRLVFKDNEGKSMGKNSWIQFDTVKQEIYALPMEDNVGSYNFFLEAIDSEGAAAKEQIVIVVRQHSYARIINHQFTLQMEMEKKYESEFASKLDWQAAIIERLAQHLDNGDTDDIAVLHFSDPPHISFQWKNDSLSSHTYQIRARVGELLRYTVPYDTFYDTEDGHSRYMQLTLKTNDYQPIPEDSWLQFDVKNREFYGLPMQNDIGRKEYTLVCTDQDGLSVNDALVVLVADRPLLQRFNVEFRIHISTDFNAFMRDTRAKTRAVEKIANLFGDMDTSNIVVKSIEEGSVVLTWHNSSIPYQPCPHALITDLRRYMLNNNGTITKRLSDTFLPDFNVTRAEMIPIQICQGEGTFNAPVPSPPPPHDPAPSGSDDDYLVTFVVPAVICAALLLIAAVIACILYRRKRKGNMEVNKAFTNRGIPIIFAEELDDTKPEPAKEPMILRDEKPPPEYHRGMSGTSSPAMRSDEPSERTPLRDDPDDPDPASYQPPPPFATDPNRNNRPKVTPTYRKPPPYVPP